MLLEWLKFALVQKNRPHFCSRLYFFNIWFQFYCPTRKTALLKTNLPLSQNPLKIGLSTK